MKKLILLACLLVLTAGCGDDKPSKPTKPGKDENVTEFVLNCDKIALQTPGQEINYCTNRSSAENQEHVLYFFHGIRGNARQLFEGATGEFVRQVRAVAGKKAPVFVSLSLGEEGLIKENAEEILRQTLPKLEDHFGLEHVTRRDLVGTSMGGHNVLRLAAVGASHFHSVSLLCPALIPFNPFNAAEIRDYTVRHSRYLNQSFFQYLVDFFRREFPTEQAWQANNPLLSQEAGKYDRLKVFVSTGRMDTLGFFEGSNAFVENAHHRRAPVKWTPVNGGHCAFDVQGLIQFLMP